MSTTSPMHRFCFPDVSLVSSVCVCVPDKGRSVCYNMTCNIVLYDILEL